MSVFDAVAPQFDRHRALPDSAAKAVRAAVLSRLAAQARLLDLGAGSGRVGWPFIAAGDNYTGVDLSFGMLQAFKQRAPQATLVQADGCALPFANRAFDGVLLVQIFGGLKNWRALIDEILRVLRPRGLLLLGRTQAPDGGVDARMKRQLDAILEAPAAANGNVRAQAELHLEERAVAVDNIEAATWTATRTPRGFIERHRNGARFGTLPRDTRERALQQLSGWTVRQFGSLDAPFAETHSFTLRIFTFER
ncbi:MAG: class I SAM-dependent methyltransferase [Pseudolabrys sp.]|nr:class I SAM-dependent methyltransferase [Pseudolabrys sp.]